ncbi:hypothetical protein BVIET440_20122 [Burkholderia vietnamiensis]
MPRADVRYAIRERVPRVSRGRMESGIPAGQPARVAGGGGAAPTSGVATGGGGADECAHACGRESSCGQDSAGVDVSECIVSKCVRMRMNVKGTARRPSSATGYENTPHTREPAVRDPTTVAIVVHAAAQPSQARRASHGSPARHA